MDSESGLKSIEYKWSANENYTDNDMYPVEDGEVVPYDGNGTVYLHVRAEDNTGNITRVTYGPYTRISEPAGYAIVRTAREVLPVPWFELSEKAYNALRIQITPPQRWAALAWFIPKVRLLLQSVFRLQGVSWP